MKTKEQKAIDLISKCEGCVLHAYLDTNKIPTIGIGTIRYPNGTKVKIGDVCTKEQAAHYLNDHLSRFVYPSVLKLQAQFNFSDEVFAAMCSLGYNIGSALSGNSILAALASGDLEQLAHAFRKYVKSGGAICPGLENRREIEIKLFNV